MQESDPAVIPTAKAWFERHPKTIIVTLTLICLLPFAGKAVHIDDPLFIWAARQMEARCWDPYGFDINWYGWAMPMHEVTKNPPLASALIYLLTSMFGENEFALHLGFFSQAIAVILGTYALARRLCHYPLPAALVTLTTPIFVVSSTTLMCDVLMVAFWVWALVFWVKGLDENRTLLLALAGVFASACLLTKYFGIALIPLMFVYALVRNRNLGRWVLFLLVPIVTLVLYESATRILYGHGLVLDAFAYTNQNGSREIGNLSMRALAALGFTGCCAILIFFCRSFWSTNLRRVGAIAGLILLPTIWILSKTLPGHFGSSVRTEITLLWAVLGIAGIFVLVLPLIEWLRHRDAETILLLLWVWGTFAFASLNWTINARSVLPIVPALAVILFRQIGFASRPDGVRLIWPFLTATTISLLVCLADYKLANSAETAVAEIRTRFRDIQPTRIWFQGHWGFQYYAELCGWRPFDLNRPPANPGDLIILPFNNTNLKALPADTTERLAIIEVPTLPWITTMSRPLGAGFYMHTLGPLPFSIGNVAPEKYYVLQIR